MKTKFWILMIGFAVFALFCTKVEGQQTEIYAFNAGEDFLVEMHIHPVIELKGESRSFEVYNDKGELTTLRGPLWGVHRVVHYKVIPLRPDSPALDTLSVSEEVRTTYRIYDDRKPLIKKVTVRVGKDGSFSDILHQTLSDGPFPEDFRKGFVQTLYLSYGKRKIPFALLSIMIVPSEGTADIKPFNSIVEEPVGGVRRVTYRPY